jgi:hypothetical protein
MQLSGVFKGEIEEYIYVHVERRALYRYSPHCKLSRVSCGMIYLTMAHCCVVSICISLEEVIENRGSQHVPSNISLLIESDGKTF